ncbi:MAG: DPP IV N-terminal domain-containing protein [Armatimonadetes bacterium]|nr:DPP IV N-terminal domain-containing protein [Armatimonadota bacterium]
MFAAVGGGGSDLYVMDLTTSRLTRVAETPEEESDPEWLPHGQGVVFGRRASLWVCRSDGSGERRLTTEDGVRDSLPNVSPDGRQVLFQRAAIHRPNPYGVPMWFGFDAFLVNLEGGPATRVTERQQFSGLSPRWLPSGKEFLFFDAGIWRGDLAGHAERLRSGVYPDPSPTDDWMAYVHDEEQRYHWNVYLSRLDGTHARRLTDFYYCMYPRFSPDGQWVYFRAGDSGRIGSIYRIRIDGTELTLLVRQKVLRRPTRYLAKP